MKKGFDWILLLVFSLIFVLGFSVLLTQEQSLAFNQLKFFLLGILLFFLLSLVDYRFFEHFYLGFYFLVLLLLLFTLFFGKTVRGATRWVSFGSFSFQTSEIVKPLLIVSLASFLKKSKKTFDFLKNLFLFLLPVVLIFLQPDLGSALILVIIFGAMFLFSRMSLPLILLLIFLFFVSLPVGWHFLRDYQKERIFSFLNPETDSLGANYNLIQSIIAVGSGGFSGKGLGFGSQSQLKFLPERHTDFIFASLAEELGFLGSSFFLLLYFFLLARILKIAVQLENEFAKVTTLGIFCFFFSEFLINVAMNLGLLPITGITLPLVSSGGSSLLASMICLGVIESITQRTSRV